MPSVRCPIDGCTYETPDIDPVIAAALITTHATTHQSPGGVAAAAPTARPEKVKRPHISPAGTTEDWQYFKSRWSDYVKATKLNGTDKIIQLLECCDEQLRKDLTRDTDHPNRDERGWGLRSHEETRRQRRKHHGRKSHIAQHEAG